MSHLIGPLIKDINGYHSNDTRLLVVLISCRQITSADKESRNPLTDVLRFLMTALSPLMFQLTILILTMDGLLKMDYRGVANKAI